MPDVHNKATRSRNMAAIKAKDSKPELLIRRGLFRRGFRYRLHARHLPGCPDLVLPKYKAAIQVHGCFWHGHDCDLFQWPISRSGFWRDKIGGNQVRDASSDEELIARGWRVLTIWECAIRGRQAMPLGQVLDRAAAWIRAGALRGDIRGRRSSHGTG